MRRIVVLWLLCWICVSGCNDKVEPETTDYMPLRAFPNPFMEYGSLHVWNNSSQDGTLKVFDPKGEIILNETVKLGAYAYNIDGRNRPSGKYQVVYKLGSIVYTAELIKI